MKLPMPSLAVTDRFPPASPLGRSLRSALLALLASAFPAAAAPKPNIVLIVADDLGYGDLGCYGSSRNPTPHIDALAKEGLRFTDFHSAGAMCSPTRASILTGRYPQRFGRIFDSALSGTKQRHLGLPLEAVTLAELLRERGYATGCFGKWHLGYEPPFLPTRQGFETFRGLHSGDGDFHTHVDRSGNEDWWHDETLRMESGYTTELLTDHATEFIEEHRHRPFFLYLPHLAIHFPWQGPDDPPHREPGTSYHDDKWGLIPDPANVAPHVRAMIESLDASTGAIVAALEHWDLRRRTLVIFTSDNGGYLTYSRNFRNISSNGPFRGQKTQLYEGGHRVPLIVSWPGRIEPGTTEETTHSNDFFPTLTRLAGLPAEELSSDGVDLGPLLFHGKSLPDRALYWRTRRSAAVRKGPWKLLRRKETTTALHHLGRDPGEQTNLIDEHPQLAKKLETAWESWNASVNESANDSSP